MGKVSFAEVHAQILQELDPILEQTTDVWRKELNKRISIVDISYDALKVSTPKLTEKQYLRLLQEFHNSSLPKASCESFDELILSWVNPADGSRYKSRTELVTIGSNVFVVGPSYSAVQSNISSILKKAIDSIPGSSVSLSKYVGVDENNKTVVNIGHIYGDSGLVKNDTAAMTTPLKEQVVSIEETLLNIHNSGGNLLNPSQYNAIQKRITNIYKRVIKEHSFSITTGYSSKEFKNASEVAGQFFVAMTLQTTGRNSKLATIESDLKLRVTNLLKSEKIMSMLLNQHRSNSFLEDIHEAIAATIQGRAVKNTHSSGTKKSSPTTLSPLKDASPKLDAISSIRLPALRTKKGTFTSLTSIKNMINLQLMEQVAKNMGKGNAKSILNFRTGRFAASAHVEQLVRNKDQSITAFYTYLKYPYATFQPGGRQGYPESRDPRLLISKSIRQLAAEQMSERMKTICV